MKSFPTDEKTTFLVCEDFRSEPGGKASLLGAFLGGDINIEDPEEEGGALPSLVFVFIFNDGLGSFTPKFEILAPDNQPVTTSFRPAPAEKKPNQAMSFIFKIAPFPVKKGKYRVKVSLDETDYVRELHIGFSGAK